MSIWSSNLQFVQNTLRLPIGLVSPLQNPSLMRTVPTPQMLMLRLRLLLATPVFLRSLFPGQSSWSWRAERRKDALWTSGRNLRTILDGKPYPVYIGDDLTKRRATLAFRARQLRWDGVIQDTWIMNSKIWAKDNRGRISQIYNEDDLKKLSSR